LLPKEPEHDSFLHELEKQAEIEEETQKLMLDISSFKNPAAIENNTS